MQKRNFAFKSFLKRFLGCHRRFQGGVPSLDFTMSLLRRLLTRKRLSMTSDHRQDRVAKLERISENIILNAFILSAPKNLSFRRLEGFMFYFSYFKQKFLFLFSTFLRYLLFLTLKINIKISMI